MLSKRLGVMGSSGLVSSEVKARPYASLSGVGSPTSQEVSAIMKVVY